MRSQKNKGFGQNEILTQSKLQKRFLVARVSCSITFKPILLKKYGLSELKGGNQYAPLVQFGVYTKVDYRFLHRHRGKVLVVWRGTDATRITKERSVILKRKNLCHISIGKFISKDLDRWGIKYKEIPVSATSLDIKCYPRGDKIYCYGQYNADIVDEVEKRLDIEMIRTNCKTFSREELMNVYKECFIGLRLTNHDGLPNTVMELGLMGRRSIYNGGTPHSIPWTNIDDICESIKKEYKIRHKDNSIIHKDFYNFLNIGTDWLKLKT